MEQNKKVEKIENDVSDLKTRMAVAESNIKELREDIGGIKDNTTWILRLVIGGLIMAVVAFLINGGFAAWKLTGKYAWKVKHSGCHLSHCYSF